MNEIAYKKTGITQAQLWSIINDTLGTKSKDKKKTNL